MIKELLRVDKKINKILKKAEEEDTEFPGLVGKLSEITMYGRLLSIHIVLGIIDEFIKESSEIKKQKAMSEFDEEIVQEAYDRVSMEWNNRNKVN